MVIGNLPDAEGNADLGVVGLGRTDNGVVLFEQLVQPLFDDRLAVRTGDTDDGAVELRTDVRSQVLQGLYGIAGDEGTHAFRLQFRYIFGSVVLVRLDGEEQHFRRLAVIGCQLPTVRQQMTDLQLFVSDDR